MLNKILVSPDVMGLEFGVSWLLYAGVHLGHLKIFLIHPGITNAGAFLSVETHGR